MISPGTQDQNALGTEVTETPKTSSTGSQPIECSNSASSMLRSEVTGVPRAGSLCSASHVAAASISSRMSGPGGRSVTTAAPSDGAAPSGRSP